MCGFEAEPFGADALLAQPDWLLVYGEGEEFNADTGWFQSAPDLITLVPRLGPDAPGDALYRFEAPELKAANHRLDGALWPRGNEAGTPEQPVVPGPADALNQPGFLRCPGHPGSAGSLPTTSRPRLPAPAAQVCAVAALDSYLEWLMVYREGAEFSNEAGFSQRYPTMPARGGSPAPLPLGYALIALR